MSSQVNLVDKHMDLVGYSGIRRVMERASDLAAQGHKVIRFEVGRPDFDTPAHVKEAAKTALDQGQVYYTLTAGIIELREAFAASIAKYKGVQYDPSEIIVTIGGQEAMFATLCAMLAPGGGDEVLIPVPGYLYAPQVYIAGGVPVEVPLQANNNYQFDFAAAQKKVTKKTKAIIVSSPTNPTGGVLTKEQIQEVCDFANKNGLIVISDEPYDRLLYDGAVHHTPAAMPGMKDKTIMLGSLSKTYSMTGWRIGYIAGPAEFITGAMKVHQYANVNCTSFAQWGAVAALNGSQDCVDAMVKEFGRRREMMLGYLNKMPGMKLESIPRGAFYFFPKVTVPGVTSAAVADYILDEAHVAVVDGACFGSYGDGYIRISYAQSYEDCEQGMIWMTKAMTKLVNGEVKL